MWINLALGGFISPFVSWPIEKLLPYPYLIEEIVKALLLFFFANYKSLKNKLESALVVGISFAISESVFYSFNIYSTNNFQVMGLRLFLTTLLHFATSLLIILPVKKNKAWILAGLSLAILLHFLYNRSVAA